MRLHVNNCCQGAVACLYQEGGIYGIRFCDQTDGRGAWGGGGGRGAYNRDSTWNT